MLGNLFNRISKSRIGQFLGNVGRKIGQIYDTAIKVPVIGEFIRKSPIGVAVEGTRKAIDIGRRVFQKPETLEQTQQGIMSRYPAVD